MKTLETAFERFLWLSRFIMIVPVALSLLMGLAVLLVNTVDAVALMGSVATYLTVGLDETARDALRLNVLARVVGVVDGYLIAAILFIFGLGIYELFVNKIDNIEGSDFARRLLLIRSLDDLKDRLANMIVVILIVKFFQIALETKYANAGELLLLAAGILMLGAALYLTGRTNLIKKEKEKDAAA